MNKLVEINLAILSTNKNQYSETFIQNHIQRLPFKIFLYSNGYLPSELSLNRGVRFMQIAKPKKFYSRTKNPLNDLKKSFLQNRIQVVLAEYGPAGVEVMSICEELDLPLIVHFHGFDTYRDDALNSYGKEYLRMFKIAESIICVSEDMRIQLLNLGCPSEKLKLYPYGIDVDSFNLKREEQSNQNFVTCGRFVEKKGPTYSIKAFAMLLEKLPNTQLTMIGDGELLTKCKALVQNLGISDNVSFAGVLNQKEVRQIFAKSSIFLQHSIRTVENDSEGSPLSIMEASASGLAVVSTKHAGIPEIVEDEVTGLLIEEGDVEEMAKKMIHLMKNPDIVKELGKEGVQRMLKLYDQKRYLNQISSLIESCVSR